MKTGSRLEITNKMSYAPRYDSNQILPSVWKKRRPQLSNKIRLGENFKSIRWARTNARDSKHKSLSVQVIFSIIKKNKLLFEYFSIFPKQMDSDKNIGIGLVKKKSMSEGKPRQKVKTGTRYQLIAENFKTLLGIFWRFPPTNTDKTYHPAGDVLWVFVEPGNVIP